MMRPLILGSACALSLSVGTLVRFPHGDASVDPAAQSSLPAAGVWRPAARRPERHKPSPPPVETVGDLYALVVPAEQIAVRSAVSETLEELDVAEGDVVETRQVVARVRRDEAVAELAQRGANVAAARSRMRAAEAEHRSASHRLELQRGLSGDGAIAPADLFDSEQRGASTAASLEAARQELRREEHAVDALERALRRYDVVSPISGRVTEVLCRPGQYVDRGDVLLWVTSHRKKLKLHIPIDALLAGEPPRVAIRVDGAWREVSGGVARPGYNPDGTVTATYDLSEPEELSCGRMFPAKIITSEMGS